MDQLRKAGTAMRDADRWYSDRIANMYPDTIGGNLGAMVGGGIYSFERADIPGDGWQERAVSYALPAVNAVPKYVLPAAGLTLAGRGLYDLTNQFGGAADQQEPSQLTL